MDDFFAEAGAGWQFLARLEVTAPAAATRATANTAARGQRAATAAGSSDSSSSAARVVRPCANVVSYIGCCPASAAHVYERPEYDAVLRTALLPCGAGFLALGLDRWEVRLALCGQLVAAARELVKRGVVARCVRGGERGAGEVGRGLTLNQFRKETVALQEIAAAYASFGT